MKKKKLPPLPIELPFVKEFTQEEKLELEREMLGIYLTAHPHRQNLDALRIITTCDLRDIEGEEHNSLVKVAGVIDSLKQVVTRTSKKEMAFLNLSDDLSYSTEVVVFPYTFQRYKALLQPNRLIILEGKIQNQEGKFSLIADAIFDPFSGDNYVDNFSS